MVIGFLVVSRLVDFVEMFRRRYVISGVECLEIFYLKRNLKLDLD